MSVEGEGILYEFHERVYSFAHSVLNYTVYVAMCCDQGRPKHGCNVFIVKLQN